MMPTLSATQVLNTVLALPGSPTAKAILMHLIEHKLAGKKMPTHEQIAEFFDIHPSKVIEVFAVCLHYQGYTVGNYFMVYDLAPFVLTPKENRLLAIARKPSKLPSIAELLSDFYRGQKKFTGQSRTRSSDFALMRRVCQKIPPHTVKETIRDYFTKGHYREAALVSVYAFLNRIETAQKIRGI